MICTRNLGDPQASKFLLIMAKVVVQIQLKIMIITPHRVYLHSLQRNNLNFEKIDKQNAMLLELRNRSQKVLLFPIFLRV